MMGITYFFIGRIYFGHIALRRSRRRDQGGNDDLHEEERGEANLAANTTRGENEGD